MDRFVDHLPDHVLMTCFANLQIQDKLRCSSVCSRWKNLINDCSAAWVNIQYLDSAILSNFIARTCPGIGTDNPASNGGSVPPATCSRIFCALVDKVGPHLRSIRLGDAEWVSWIGARIMCHVVHKCPNLQSVEYKLNAVDDSVFYTDFLEPLTQLSRTLEIWWLEVYRVVGGDGLILTDKIFNVILQLKCLHTFHQMLFNNAGAMVAGPGMMEVGDRLTFLQRITLSMFTFRNPTEIGLNLSHFRSLSMIRMNCCWKFDESHVEALFGSVPRLRGLVLTRCNVENGLFSSILRHGVNLQSLALYDHCLTTEGIVRAWDMQRSRRQGPANCDTLKPFRLMLKRAKLVDVEAAMKCCSNQISILVLFTASEDYCYSREDVYYRDFFNETGMYS